MDKDITFVKEQLTLIYPQLQINCKNVCGAGFNTWGEDLLAMSLEIFLEKPIEYQLKVIEDGKLENFITYVMNLQLKSGSSRFYHQYRKASEKSRELYDNYNYRKELYMESPFKSPDIIPDEPDELMECLKAQQDKLDPFEKMVLQRHMVNGERAIDLSSEFDIPYHTFLYTKKLITEKLSKACRHLYY